MEWDIRDTYSELRTAATRETPIPKLDLLIHTNGGDPVAAYVSHKRLGAFARIWTCSFPKRHTALER
jgi:ClpP class serine protease